MLTFVLCGMLVNRTQWEVATQKKVATLSGHTKCVRGLVATSGGDGLLTCSYDQTLRLWQ